MIYRAVIVAGVIITRSACNPWNYNLDHKETWLNGVEKPEEYLLKMEEGIVFADESDVNGFEVPEKHEAVDIYSTAVEDRDKDKFEFKGTEDSQVLHDFFTTITTSTYGSKSTYIANQQEVCHYPDNICSQLHIKKSKEVGIDEIIKNAWGTSYSFYQPRGGCKSPREIQDEIKELADFDIIRVNGTDCEGLINIIKVLRPGQQVFADIYYLDRIDVFVEIITKAINSIGGDWSVVNTISVGNELISLNEATVEEIGIAIAKMKDLLYGRGYNGFVVNTDTLDTVMRHSEICEISDYISVNSDTYSDGLVSLRDVGPWLKQQMTLLRSVCGVDKNVVLSANGWPIIGLAVDERVFFRG